MKKIKLLTFLSALLCSFFIFNFNYRTSANNGNDMHEIIDLDYSIDYPGNWEIFGVSSYGDNVEMSIVVTDDIFINYESFGITTDNIFLQLDNFVTGFDEPSIIYISNLGIRNNNELIGDISIPKVYFNHYIYNVLGTTEDDFHYYFREYLSDGLDNYFKLYVRKPENFQDSGMYLRFSLDFGSFDLIDSSSTTNLYKVITNINTTYRVGNDVILYFNQGIRHKLRTPLNRGFNSYNIIRFQKIDDNKWQLEYDIAILKSMIDEYDGDVRYILFDLIDVFIKIVPSDDYTNGYNAGYTEGYSVGYNEGYDFGYNRGYDIGYNEGVIVGAPEAYERGYKDGYNESFIGKMDKWLVPGIIIVMLLGGYFTIARKKRDGDI